MVKIPLENPAETFFVMVVTKGFTTIHKIALLVTMLIILPGKLSAAVLTWDTDPGAGFQAGNGSWDSDAYWSTDGTNLISWPNNNDTVVFSAMNPGTYDITLNSNVQVDSMQFLEQTFSINGGSINLNRGIFVESGILVKLNTLLTGSNGMSIYGSDGTVYISKDNSYTGATNIYGGYLQVGTGGNTGSIPAGSSVNISTNCGLIFNRADSLYITTTISGTGRLQQLGTGTVIITGYAMHSGQTDISAGTLQIGNGSYDGQIMGTSAINVTGTLAFNRSGTTTFPTSISGTGNLVQKGTGTVELSGACTYSGSTNISRGTLKASNGLPSTSSVVICSTGTLATVGFISGNTIVTTGGRIMPAEVNTGKLTFQQLQLDNTSIMQFNVGTVSDSIMVSGNLQLDGVINIDPVAGFGAGTYPLLICTGTITNNGVVLGVTPGGYTCTVSLVGDRVNLVVITDDVKVYTGAVGDHKWSTPGNWASSTVPLTNDIVQFNVSNNICTLDVDVTVRSMIFAAACSLALNHHKLTITKELDLLNAGPILSDIGDTIFFSGPESRYFKPKADSLLPVIKQTGTGVTYQTSSGLSARKLILDGGMFDFGPWYYDTIHGDIEVLSGGLNVNSAMVCVTGNVNLGNSAEIMSNGGKIDFCASGNQILVPVSGKIHPAIVKSNSGMLTVTTNRLRTKSLKVFQGVIKMDTALTADTVDIQTTASLQLDTDAGGIDTLNNFNGTGALHTGNTTVFSKTTVRHSNLTLIDGCGKYTLFNAGMVDFEPKLGYTYAHITKTGSGTTNVTLNPVKAHRLDISGGEWKFVMYNDSLIDTVNISGGTFRVGIATVKVGNMFTTGGSLRFGHGTLAFRGKGIVDLSGLSNMYSDTGTIVFSGNGSSSFNYIHPTSQIAPVIKKQGKVTDTLVFVNSLRAQSLIQDSGIIVWGNNVTHQVDTLRSFRGEMNFGNCTLSVEKGDVQLGGIDVITPGTATLKLNAVSGIQHLYASATQILPKIKKSGNAGMMLMLNNLSCKGLTIEAGNFDFAGYNVSATGDVKIINGSSTTFTGLDGRTLSATGIIQFKGQSGNLLNCNPASFWNVTASGTISAEYASIGHSVSTSAQGVAYSTCTDAGNNSNWFFTVTDITPPTGGISITDNNGYTNDADPSLTISHAGADSMRIGLTETAAGAAPWKAVGTLDSIDVSAGGEGLKTVFIHFRDIAGNISTWYSGTTTYDVTAPTASVVITDRYGHTQDADPAVTISGTGIDSTRFGFGGDTALYVWQDYRSLDSINISSGGEGKRYLYLQVKDTAGNRSDWYVDSTIFDTTTPVAALLLHDNTGFTNDNDPPVSITGSGIEGIRLGTATDTASYAWRGYSPLDSADISGSGEGVRLVYVQLQDTAGNRSAWHILTTTYDITAPVGSITISDHEGFTNDDTPALTFTGAGVDSIRIGMSGDTSASVWRNFVALDSIDISAGGEGAKKVYLQMKDLAGNRSAWMSDTTTYDIKLPNGTILTDGNYHHGTWNDTIAGTANDALSGLDTVQVEIMNELTNKFWTGSAWQSFLHIIKMVPVATNWSISLPVDSLDGASYLMSMTVKDRAGNQSSTVSGSFTYHMLPVADFTADQVSGNIPLTVQFTAASTGVVDQYDWDFGDGSTGNGDNISHTYVTTGRFTVQLIANGPGGADTALKPMYINIGYDAPIAQFSQNVDNGIAAPLTVYCSDQSSGIIDNRIWIFGDGTTETGSDPVHVYQKAGVYQIKLKIDGPGGSDSTFGTSFQVTDTTMPRNVENLTATSVNCARIVLNWNQPTMWDADSVVVSISDTGYAAFHNEGKMLHTIDGSETADTITGIPVAWEQVYVSMFTKDSSENWSEPVTLLMQSNVLPDCTAPDHNLLITTDNRGDTVVTIDIKAGTAQEQPDYLFTGIGLSKEMAISTMVQSIYQDTLISVATALNPGWWYLSTQIADMAGNRSVMRIDSVKVNNIPPVILPILTKLIYEDTGWSTAVITADKNGDTVKLSFVEIPDKMTVSGNVLAWTPDDNDIGSHRLLLSAEDSRGGTTVDTFFIEVENREEAPDILLTGDSMAIEDVEWKMTVQTTDEDRADAAVVTIDKMPAWVSFNDGVLSGTPPEGALSNDTLKMYAVDLTGLKVYRMVNIHVESVNDAPSLGNNTIPDTLIENDSVLAFFSVSDPDKLDTARLFFETPVSWLTLKNVEYDKIAGSSRFTLRLIPLQKDTGIVVIRLAGTDQSGSTVTYEQRIVVIDKDDPPQAPVLTKKVAYGAIQYVVKSVDDYDREITYQGALKSLTDSMFIRAGSNTDGVFRFYPLVDGRYSFNARAVDKKGGATDYTTDTVIITGASSHSTSDTAWEMWSIPGTYNVEKLTNTEFLLTWNESIQEKQLYHYYQVKEEIETVLPGTGYWRKGFKKDSVTLTERQLTSEPVLLPLHHKDFGWNQIASPFPYPVVWRHPHNGLWKWNTNKNDFEEVDSILEPWNGYWVQVDRSDTVTIDTTPFFKNDNLAKKKKTWFSDENEWIFNLSLVSANGNDAENRFGFSANADDGYDKYDRTEPPRIMGKQSLSFCNATLKKGVSSFAADIRKNWKPLNVFEFSISSGEQSGSSTISIDGYEKESSIYMYLVNADSTTCLEPGKKVTFDNCSGVAYKTLFVVKDPSIMKRLPLRFSFGHPYPNPCVTSTRLEYSLPYRWNRDGSLADGHYNVSMIVYDLKGRKVKTLVNEVKTPGLYHILWDGADKNGNRTASGHYFIRLKTNSFESVKKIIMVR